MLKLRKAGKSFRAVAEEAGLSLQTVRTIVGRDAGTDRTSARRLQRIQPDKASSNRERARKRTRDALPRAMTETVEKAGKLLKDARFATDKEAYDEFYRVLETDGIQSFLEDQPESRRQSAEEGH